MKKNLAPTALVDWGPNPAHWVVPKIKHENPFAFLTQHQGQNGRRRFIICVVNSNKLFNFQCGTRKQEITGDNVIRNGFFQNKESPLLIVTVMPDVSAMPNHTL